MMVLRPVARATRARASGSRASPRLVGSTKVCPPACLNSSASSRATASSRSWRLSRLELKLWRTQPRLPRPTGCRARPRSAPLAGSRNITSKSIRRCSWGSVIPIASPAMGPSTVWACPESPGAGMSWPDGLDVLVHAGLELPEQIDRGVVVEREELGREDAAHVLGPVDPEVRVGEPGPGQRVGRASAGYRLGIDQEAQAPLLAHAREGLDVVRERRHRRLEHADLQISDVVLAHEIHRVLLQHLRAVMRAPVHDHEAELQVVGHGAVEAAAAHVELRLLGDAELDRGQGAVGPATVHRGEPVTLGGRELEGGVLHAELPEDVILEVAVQPLAADLPDHLAGPVDADALVPLVSATEPERGASRCVRAGW